MSVSVVIPLWNGSPWIRETLDSVLAQELRPREVVVVDDGSTDGSPEIVRSYREVALVRNAGKGTPTARNYGLAHTTSPFLAFLDHDDVWHPAHLRLLSGVLAREPEVPAVAASVSTFVDGRAPRFDPAPDFVEPLDPWASFPFGCEIETPSAVLIRRVALDEAGGFGPYHGMSDAHLWLRLSERRCLARFGAKTVGWRRHGGSQTVKILAEGRIAYVEMWARSRDDAFEKRLPLVTSTERAALERRRQLGHAVLCLAKAHVLRDRRGFAETARRLDALLVREPAGFQEASLAQLAWALAPSATGDREAREQWRLLVGLNARWPRDAWRARRALRVVALKHLVHRFLKPHRFGLAGVLRAVFRRMRDGPRPAAAAAARLGERRTRP